MHVMCTRDSHIQENMQAAERLRGWWMLAGRRTIAPREERAAAAFKLREAPTHAQVSSRDRGASRGLSPLTKPGRKVLHTRPACNSSLL